MKLRRISEKSLFKSILRAFEAKENIRHYAYLHHSILMSQRNPEIFRKLTKLNKIEFLHIDEFYGFT